MFMHYRIHLKLSQLHKSFSTKALSKLRQIQSPERTLLPHHDIYTHLLESCLQHCKKMQPRQLFDEMSNWKIFASKVCEVIHSQSLKYGFASKGLLGNAIVDLYSKCGNVESAEKAFCRLEEEDYLAWNSILSLYSRNGLLGKVFERFKSMKGGGVVANRFTYAIVFSVCARLGDVELGKQVHSCVVKTGFECDSFCGGALIDLYSKCGTLFDARMVFDRLIVPDTISWTAMISGYVVAGFPDEALALFVELQKLGCVPDQVAFGTAINACFGLGRLDVAWRLFSEMPNQNVVAWNVMISGHCKVGLEVEAIKIFQDMTRAGVQPTQSTLGTVVRAIASVENLDYGVQVHAISIKHGLNSSVYVGSSLISMYAKCHKVQAAKEVFYEISEKNDVLCNALLGGYAQNGYACEVVELFIRMNMAGFQHDEFTYTSILSASACLENMEMGGQLHASIIKNRYALNLCVGNALVDMYAKCGALEDARRQFDLLKEWDNVSWNAIIVGYVQEEEEEEAFNMFRAMMLEGFSPHEVSFASILSACADLLALDKGEQIHCLLIKCGLETCLYAGSSLVDLYSKCGHVEAATEVFSCMPERSIVSTNALIAGYAQSNLENAVNMLRDILIEGLIPSVITFASLLDACAEPTTMYLGRQIHGYIVKSGISILNEFLACSLLQMYLNSQGKREAIALLHEFPNSKSPVLWTALISGLAHNDGGVEALNFYYKMRICKAIPDQATFTSVLKACSSVASLMNGRKIHSLIVLTGFDKDELICSALLDMYAKCGDVMSSEYIFDEMVWKKDVISWNSMIVGYAKNGYAEKALKIFEEMKERSIQPDEITFLGTLTACSHAGMVSEGREIFNDMITRYGVQVQPRANHYACMIDIYGRWGFLREAEEFIANLNFEPDSRIWTAYLSACRLHGDDMRGNHAAKKLMEMEPQNSSHYVQLSNIFAASGKWEEANSLRMGMKEKGVRKLPGCTWM